MDEKDFQLLYETHYRALKNYLTALCKNQADAEDLTQEAFLRYESRLPSFRRECSDFTMLCKIGKNLWLNRKRKEKRLTPLPEQPPDLKADSFEEKLEDEDEALRIHQALHKLPEPYKEVFMLHIFGELNFRKIAALFGKSESWAKMTFYRAKAKIVKNLEEQ
ncbi:MAG: RNA polymerase sigma factor [Eubacterium sp.]|nr:RNA polymerase sigma factor [Eubacterium sp.]